MSQHSLPSFESQYALVQHPATATGHPEMLETYGADLAIVETANPLHVWSIIDSESSNALLITAGFHRINVIAYAISLKPWTHPTETYLWA